MVDVLRLDVGCTLSLGPTWQSSTPSLPERSAKLVGQAPQQLSQSPPTRKRSRDDSSPPKDASISKAGREKQRRDRLNDRFLELGRELDPSMGSKADKAVVLSDTVRFLSHLKAEAASLLIANQQLRDQIKELKAEKIELRDEKARWKAERERLQLQLQSFSMPLMTTSAPAAAPSFTPPSAASFTPSSAPSPRSAAAAAAAIQAAAVAAFASQLVYNKPADAAPPSNTVFSPTLTPTAPSATPTMPSAADASCPPVSMWQWIPGAAVDLSIDQTLRPAVA